MTSFPTGAGIAASAAVVAVAFSAGYAPAFAAEGEKQVHCYGINSCKGTSDCKTARNECKGMNDCKGQGFKVMTIKQCEDAGGSLTEPK